MAIEIERKFLVRGEFKNHSVKKLEILQGYLSVDPARIIRLRITNKKAVLSGKAPEGKSDFRGMNGNLRSRIRRLRKS